MSQTYATNSPPPRSNPLTGDGWTIEFSPMRLTLILYSDDTEVFCEGFSTPLTGSWESPMTVGAGMTRYRHLFRATLDGIGQTPADHPYAHSIKLLYRRISENLQMLRGAGVIAD